MSENLDLSFTMVRRVVYDQFEAFCEHCSCYRLMDVHKADWKRLAGCSEGQWRTMAILYFDDNFAQKAMVNLYNANVIAGFPREAKSSDE